MSKDANLHLRVSQSKKKEITKHAAESDMSITAYIISAINEKMSESNISQKEN